MAIGTGENTAGCLASMNTINWGRLRMEKGMEMNTNTTKQLAMHCLLWASEHFPLVDESPLAMFD